VSAGESADGVVVVEALAVPVGAGGDGVEVGVDFGYGGCLV
jgi:hypothetical protein